MQKNVFSIFNQICVLLSAFAILLCLTNTKAYAATVSCQKPADVVISLDNSDSISSYKSSSDPDYDREAKEWSELMQFVTSFANGFVVSPQYTHTAIVTFDGLSVGDIVNYGKPGYPGHKMIPGHSTLPSRLALGSDVYSDTIIGLANDPDLLTNASNTGAIDKLAKNRFVRTKPYNQPCGYSWYREPPEYYPVKKFKPADPASGNDYLGCPINGFKIGATDWGAGLNRSYDLLKNSPRFNNSSVEKIIIQISDGQPSDNNGNIDPTDPPISTSTDAKSKGVKIFSIMVGLDSMCDSNDPVSGSACQTAKNNAMAWTQSIASDPKPSYSFRVDRFEDFQGVVDTIINFTCGVEGLNVNGFLLTKERIETERQITVNDYYSYLRNNNFDTVLRGLSIGRHFIDFD